MAPSPLDPRSKDRGRESPVENTPYVAGLIAATATMAIVLLVPPMLVLPVLSVTLVGIGLTGAAMTWSPAALGISPARYVSAALTFIGFGAAFLADLELALPFLDSARRSP